MGPPAIVPLGVLDPVLHREHRLGVLGGDAEDAGQPHPQHGARAARRHRGGHADDVAGADGGGQRGRERAELADVALALLLARERERIAVRQVALDEAQPDGQEEVRAEQQDEERRSPHEVTGSREERFEALHGRAVYQRSARGPEAGDYNRRVSLLAGARLGPYEIVALIGAGGMGEVFRARDARLGRDVAVKVLPAAVATQPDRLRRFAQEARAAAALSHPNVVAVYDVHTDGETPYVVSELLEGETLREALQRGPMPARRAVDIAMQVASGLAAAHHKGIVHRDVKPANIFLTADGRAKVLDFGLARIVEAGDTDRVSTRIADDPPTLPGTVMGTVGYMAPEQVRGEVVDTRADVFALGTVCYEMLAGRRAFTGDTSVEVMAAIVRSDPPELSAETPPALNRVIRRCLEKQPSQRFQSAADVAFALEAVTVGTTRRAWPCRRWDGAALPVRPAIAAAVWPGPWWAAPPSGARCARGGRAAGRRHLRGPDVRSAAGDERALHARRADDRLQRGLARLRAGALRHQPDRRGAAAARPARRAPAGGLAQRGAGPDRQRPLPAAASLCRHARAHDARQRAARRARAGARGRLGSRRRSDGDRPRPGRRPRPPRIPDRHGAPRGQPAT